MDESVPKLTKAEIIDACAERTHLNRTEIHALFDMFLEQIKDALIEGRTAELRGFGTFEVHLRKGRKKARNPRTGETVSVDDHHVAVFRPGKELKQSVWDLKKSGPVD
jgi:integration host factor subunit alpha